MPVLDQLAEWKRAYQILGISSDASAHSIKQAYRRLLKRWHPDLYAADMPSHAEATRITALINQSYTTIAHAPLRYHVEMHPDSTARSSRPTPVSPHRPSEPVAVKLPNMDRVEFWVRFVCGALFGILVCLASTLTVLPDSLNPMVFVLFTLGVAVAFGFAAARQGDKFWFFLLRRWWLWP